jgi:hypothetical protein
MGKTGVGFIQNLELSREGLYMEREGAMLMSDEETICEFMESKPEMRQDDAVWWRWGWVPRIGSSLFQPPGYCWLPVRLTLDALHKVEAKLTDEQWDRYSSEFDYPASARNRKSLLHATAAQKVKALAAVLRSAVPAST